jgi:hypothetical protein
MQITEKNLFEKFQKLAKSVKQDFAKKGIAVPTRRKDGSIQLGNYIIVKENNSFYIKDNNNTVIEGPLNLAQSAVVIANDIALGRWPDTNILHNDQWYGYKEFEEQVANNIADLARKKKDTDRADFSRYEAGIALSQKQQYKKSIDARFNKLCKLT